jgi:hypothetical protein
VIAHVGDRLIVEGDLARAGLIIDVLHADGSPPYIVRWLASGYIAMVSPGQFARISPASNYTEADKGVRPVTGGDLPGGVPRVPAGNKASCALLPAEAQ